MSLTAGPGGNSKGSYQFYENEASYIEFSYDGKLDVQHSITMLCWVYFSQTVISGGPLFVYDNGYDRYVGMFIMGNKFVASFTDKKRESQNDLSAEVELNQWLYVGASYNHDTGNASLWVNGTRLEQKTFNANMTLATAYAVRMGSKRGYAFAGRITALQIYNFSLTTEQIEAVKYAGDRDKNVNCKNNRAPLLIDRISQPNDPAVDNPSYLPGGGILIYGLCYMGF